MLRISVDPATGTYTSPNDNPFFSGGGLPEIYAYGLRNPYRWSFDSATGILWVGDVGQTSREEVDQIINGGNYGWPSMEGNICELANASDCDVFEAPVHDYPRTVGRSITGGYVYRGSDFPELQGLYLFGDFSASVVYTLEDVGGSYTQTAVAFPNSGVVSVSQDNSGELYVLTIGSPNILKVQRPDATPPGSNIPDLLSDTGCFDAIDPTQPAPGLIPYDVVSPLWSDGADKQRWMALPDGETVDVNAQGDFSFPVGTILAKHFSNNGTMIETRLLMLHQSGWAGYSYQWNGAQDNASLLSDSVDANVGGLNWHYPSGAECRQCHTSVSNFALGPEVLQLNNAFTYPQTGRSSNQVFTLDAINVFTATPDPSLDNATLFALDNELATLEQRAKSYLHSNCAQCHQPGGSGRGGIDFRYDTPFADMNLCNVVPSDNLGNANARNIIPGNPNDSMVLTRMIASENSGNRMPPLASRVQDTQATDLIRAWINALAGPGCPN